MQQPMRANTGTHEEEGVLEEAIELLDGVDTVELREELNEIGVELGTGSTDETRLLTALPTFPKSVPSWPMRPPPVEVDDGLTEVSVPL